MSHRERAIDCEIDIDHYPTRFYASKYHLYSRQNSELHGNQTFSNVCQLNAELGTIKTTLTATLYYFNLIISQILFLIASHDNRKKF